MLTPPGLAAPLAVPRRFRLSPIVSIRLVRRFRSDWRFGTQSMSASRLGVDESEAYFPQARPALVGVAHAQKARVLTGPPARFGRLAPAQVVYRLPQDDYRSSLFAHWPLVTAVNRWVSDLFVAPSAGAEAAAERA